jgi:hypothetical protein
VALRKEWQLEPMPLTSRDFFAVATLEGAKACGYGDKIG